MNQEQDKVASQDDALASEPKRPEPHKQRRTRRVGADRSAADRLAGVQAIDRMAEAGRLLAEQEQAAVRAAATSAVERVSVPATRLRLPAVMSAAPQVGMAAFRRLPAHLPLYASALCLAIGFGGLLGGRYGPTGEIASTATDSERAERTVAGRREPGDKSRDEVKALRAELVAMRTNSEQLRQAENQKQANELRALRAVLEAQKAETASLKADIAARADREASTRNEKTVERIDRLERRLADPAPTATVVKATAAVELPKPETRGEKAPVQGVVLRDVARGIALVETRRGLMEVIAGDPIPGAGRVETIEKHAGRWRVVTSAGVIDAAD